jgi:hypothetical protein
MAFFWKIESFIFRFQLLLSCSCLTNPIKSKPPKSDLILYLKSLIYNVPTMPICTILTRHFLFPDYDKMRRHFKNLYFKVCQIPFDAQKIRGTVVKFIRYYANHKHPVNWHGFTPLRTL